MAHGIFCQCLYGKRRNVKVERLRVNFQINFEAKTKEQTTTLNTQGLLMEGLRMLDESKREGGSAAGEEEDVLLDT